MQKVTILCTGKLKEKFYLDAAAEYAKRLSRFCKLEICELPEERLPEDPSPAQIEAALSKEADAVRAKLPTSCLLIAMCVEGKERSSEELARYLFIYDVMIGAAIAIRRNSHLQIDILINLMKPKVRTILTIIATLAGMVFMVFLLSYSITLVQTGARTMSAGLGIPMSIPYSCMPVGIVLMLLTSIEVLFKNISALRGAGKEAQV